MTYGQQQEIERVRQWVDRAQKRVTVASMASYRRFLERKPVDLDEMQACLQLSEQLSDARKVLAELTLVRGG